MSHKVLGFSFVGESFRVDHTIIYVPRENASFHFQLEIRIDHSLKCGGQIHHSEEHDEWLK
jgi:hypothetical protein